MKKLLLFGFLMMYIPFLFAQGELVLDLNIIVPDAETFYIGDLDFIQKNSNKLIFSLHVMNNGPAVEGRFNINVIYRGQNTTEELVRAVSNQIVIPTGVNWNITNVDFNRGIELPTPDGGSVEVHIDDYQLNFDKIGFIQDYVLKTNKLPSGEYSFNISFGTVSDINQNNNRFFIKNPSFVQLSFPGTDISNPNPEEISTIAPIFQWFSDASLFDLYIYEFRETDMAIQDVFNHEAFAVIRNLSTQHFQYPITPGVYTVPSQGNLVTRSEGNLRPLERGKVYAWYVEAKIPTAVENQFEIIKSPVYYFKIGSIQSSKLQHDMILKALQIILGRSYDKVIAQLKGYVPGDQIYFNGKPISPEELMKIAVQVQKNQLLIRNIEIE